MADLSELQDEKARVLAPAREIASKAARDDRGLTAAERAICSAALDGARKLDADIEAAKKERGGIDQKMFRDLIAAHGGDGGGGLASPSRRKVTDAWPRAFRDVMGRAGLKAFTSGSISVPSLAAAVVRDPERPRSLLDVIPVEPISGTDSFAYLREIVKTHAAAPVAAGDLKPMSTYTVQKIENQVRVVAHVSEPVDVAILSDAPMLETYLRDVLIEGVELEVEDQVVAGDGVAPNLDGILSTSGIQTVNFDTDILTTARKALTALHDENFVGGVYAINPGDWEAVDLQRLSAFTAGGTDSLIFDPATQRLWGQRVVVTRAIGPGSALLLDPASVKLWERETAQIRFSDSATDEGTGESLFQRNQVMARCEVRVGFGVTRPVGVVQFNTTAAGSGS